MSALLRLVELAPVLLLGTTLVLGLGLVLGMVRARRLQQHTAETAVCAAVLFVVAALVPLPRLLQSPSTTSWASPAHAASSLAPDESGAASNASPSSGRNGFDAAAWPGGAPLRRGPESWPADPRDPVLRGVGPAGLAADTPMAGSALPTPAWSAGETRPVRVPQLATALSLASPSRSWVLLATAYLAGAAVTVLWLACGWLRVRRIVARALAVPASWQPWLAARGIAPGVSVLSSGLVDRPFCAGLRRPVVVLPAALVMGTEAPGDAAAAALLHEAAHARRGDHWRTLLFALALPVLFVHPLFWWLRRRARFAAEVVADAEAAAASGGRTTYARRLLDLVEASGRLPVAVPRAGAVFMFRRPSELSQRIEMLLSDRIVTCSAPRRAQCAGHFAGIAALTVFCIAAWGATPAAAQDPGAGAAELRRERDLLREEIAKLRQEMEALRVGGDGEAVPGRPSREGGASVHQAGQGLPPLIGEFLRGAHPQPGSAPLPNASIPVPDSSPAPGLATAPVAEPVAQPPVEPVLAPVTAPAAEPRGTVTFRPAGAGRVSASVAGAELEASRISIVDRSLQDLGREFTGLGDPAAVLEAANPSVDPGQQSHVPDVASPESAPAEPAHPELPHDPRPLGGGTEATLHLLTQCIELEGAVQQARLHAEHVARTGAPGHERESASIALRTAERKLDLVRRMIDLERQGLRGEIAAQQAHLQAATKLRENGFLSSTELQRQESSLVRLNARLELLELGAGEPERESATGKKRVGGR